MRAFDLADIDVRFEVERIRARRFNKVSEYIRLIEKDAMFSANACRDRYTAIINGSAVIPTDEDDDPDSRRMEMEKYRQERETVRAAEQAKRDKKEAEQQRIKDEARFRVAKKNANTAARRDAEQQLKADRAVKRAAQASIKAQKSSEYKKKKLERQTALEAKKAADEAERSRKVRQRQRAQAYSLANIPDITTDTPDPRVGLSLSDLKMLCAERKLPKVSVQGCSATELIKRLKDAEEKLTSAELKTLVKAKGIGLGGTKVQMQYQLAKASAMDCDSYDRRYEGSGADGDDVEMSDGDEFD
jgi:hypothetical protein